MPTPWQRDLEAAGRDLLDWLRAKLPAATDLRMSELVAPQSSGFSNETLLFELAWSADGREQNEKLVVRIQPTGYQIFPEYDLSLQFRVMERLASTEVPVPKMFWLEEDPGILGAPFYVMGQVAGRVPTDNPPYHMGGWMHDISPEARARIWWGGIESLAKIHRVDVRAADLEFLDRPELGADGLEQELSYYERYLGWAARDRDQPIAEAALDWLQKNKPKDEPTVLTWGDARIGNIIFDGTSPAAVLDWEMACLGPPAGRIALPQRPVERAADRDVAQRDDDVQRDGGGCQAL